MKPRASTPCSTSLFFATFLTLLTTGPPLWALGPEIPCEAWEPQVFRAGVADDFAFPDDPASRGAALEAAFPEATWKDFDSDRSNRFFGQTFTGLPPHIVRAQLTVHMKPHSDVPTNDALHLGLRDDGTLIYGTRIHELSEAGGTWSPATNAPTTFVLDLSALPGDGLSLISKIAAERSLDVLIQDDTAVDFMELAVWACPPYTFRAGVRDDFTPPTDAAIPGADLRARLPGVTFRSFDDTTANRHFGHTLTGLPEGIVQAELEIRMRPHPDIPGNDALHLGLEGDGSFAFGIRIADLPGAGGTWEPGTNPATLFTLDLGALPGGGDLIPKVAAEQHLAVYVQDDTAVDDIRLRVWTCPPPDTFAGVAVTGLGEADPVFVDGALLIEELSASGEDGLAVDLAGADGYCLGLLGDCPEGYWQGSALELAVTLGSLTQGSGTSEATLTLTDLGGEVGVRTDIDGRKEVRIKNGGTSVVDLLFDTPADELLAFLPSDACVQEVDWLVFTHPCRGFSVLFTEPVLIRLSDGTQAVGDRLEIGPACPVGVGGPLRRFAVRAAGLPELRATGGALQAFGLLMTPVGGAGLQSAPGSLTLTDLSDGGEAGVSIDLGEADSFYLDLAPAGLGESVPVGASLHARASGSVGGVPGQSLGVLHVTKVGTGPTPYSVVPDFTDIASPTHTVQVLDGHRLVVEIEGHTGTAARVSSWPRRVGKLDNELECYVGGFPDDTLFDLDGVLYRGDELRVLAEGEGPAIDFKSEVTLQAAGLPELTLTGAAAGREGGCTPGPTRLCLNDGRFAVEVDWFTRRGRRGVGQAIPLTADTGTFWFFDPDNLEMLIKVLDGCSINGRFWVFAAGLTNVETLVTVTDTRTGVAETFLNPQDTAFLPVQDTAAFATCPASPAAAAQRSDSIDSAARRTTADLEVLLAQARVAAAGGGKNTHGAPLLLNDGRFRVEATWRTPRGRSGAGTGVQLTEDSGYFWFFDADNVEAVVKVLDSCSFNEHFWVFAAGLTNVEVEIVVTDTATGAVRTYRNSQNTAFQPIQDTGAFPTCQ